jgi:uncharacterized OB-fold protein
VVKVEYPLTFVAWREALRDGKLLGLQCNDCGSVTCPPRKVCAKCTSENLETVELSRLGEIKSFTVCYAVPTGFEGPYVVAMADLDEGSRVMANVLDVNPETAGMELIGRRVRVGYKEIPGDFMTGQDTRLALTLSPIGE